MKAGIGPEAFKFITVLGFIIALSDCCCDAEA